jgi:hypothetical protein
MNPPVILLIPHSPACPEFAGVNILVPPPGLSADSPLLPPRIRIALGRFVCSQPSAHKFFCAGLGAESPTP